MGAIAVKLKKEKVANDKKFLLAEIIIGLAATLNFILSLVTFIYFINNTFWGIIFLIINVFIFMLSIGYCILIEQRAGYYRCQNCTNEYIPTYREVFFAPHLGRTRYMKCPKCHKKTWNKKVVD